MKGVAIILVVTGHVLPAIYSPCQYQTNIIFKICYSFHMPLFMLLSGYVEGFKDIRKTDVKRLKHKVNTLLIPWIFWTSIDHLFFDEKSLQMLLDKSFLNPSIWYLIVLFTFYAIFAFSNRFSIKISFLIQLFIWLLSYILMFFFDTTAIFRYVANHFPFYIIGYYLKKHNALFGKKSIMCIYCYLSIVIYPISMFFYTYGNTVETAAKLQLLIGLDSSLSKMAISLALWEYNHHFVAFWGCCFIWSIVIHIYEHGIFDKMKKVIEALGENSIYIYLLHGFIIKWCQQLVVSIQRNYMFSTILKATVSMVVITFAIVIPVVASWMIKDTPLNAVFKGFHRTCSDTKVGCK